MYEGYFLLFTAQDQCEVIPRISDFLWFLTILYLETVGYRANESNIWAPGVGI